MYLPMLNDEELLSYYASTVDTLTTTDLERELYKRFAARVEQDADPRLTVLDDLGFDNAHVLNCLLCALDEYDIADADELARYIKRAALLVEMLDGNADLFKRLADASANL